jgi:electron transfer flavoprotein alpha subunit
MNYDNFFANHDYTPPPFNSVILQRLVFFLNMDDMEGAYTYLYSIRSDLRLSAALEEAINSDLFYTPIQKEQAIQYIRDRLGSPAQSRTHVGMVKKQTKKMTPEQKEKMKQKKALAKEKEKARKLKEKEKARKLKEKEKERARKEKLRNKKMMLKGGNGMCSLNSCM